MAGGNQDYPWEEVDEAGFLFSPGRHYSLYGPELKVWHLRANEWIEEVFSRDKRDRKAVRRFIPVFLACIETNKRLPDGRQFALISQNTLVRELKTSKETVQMIIARVTLTGRYSSLREQHVPLIEIVESTLDGARAGRWGTGYAPVLDRTWTSTSGDVVPDAAPDGRGKAGGGPPSSGNGVPANASGTVSRGPGTGSRQPGTGSASTGTASERVGTASSGDEEPSATPCSPVDDFESPREEDCFRELLEIFPLEPGRCMPQTRKAYDGLVARGYTPQQLVEGARRCRAELPKSEAPRFPMRFLEDPDAVRAWCGPTPERFDSKLLLETSDGHWLYRFREGPMIIGKTSAMSRDGAIEVVKGRLLSVNGNGAKPSLSGG